MTVSGSRCEDQVRSDISKEDCCRSAIGKGWGSPCEPCPTQLDTGFPSGSLVDSIPGVAVDADNAPSIGPGEVKNIS